MNRHEMTFNTRNPKRTPMVVIHSDTRGRPPAGRSPALPSTVSPSCGTESRTTEHRLNTPAFTIIELLMIMGIIAVLIGLVVVGLRGIQASAARTETVNSLRQMVAGYLGYSTDNRNNLMPGFVDVNMAKTLELNAKLAPSMHQAVGKVGIGHEWMVTADQQRWANLRSYVWRLAPYVDHNWRIVMTDYREAGAMRHFAEQYETGIYGPSDISNAVTIASAPAIGLNSIFLGGDNVHGGAGISVNHPWTNFPSVNPDKIAATRMTEVLNPANIIVFAPVGRLNEAWQSDGEGTYASGSPLAQPVGYPELRPPFLLKDSIGRWTQRQWLIGTGGAVQPHTDIATGDAGLPIMRHGQGAASASGYLPIAHLDGSAIVEDISAVMLDMRRWAPGEVGMRPPPMDF